MSQSHRMMTRIATDRQQAWRDEAARDRRARPSVDHVVPMTPPLRLQWSGIDRFRRHIARGAAKA